MANISQIDGLRSVQPRRYLGRDFDSLRAMLLEHARIYHPNSTKDFSEASPGGLFLDLAAFIGDNLSFYLDHQFGELDPETAVETVNIERALRSAGVPIVGAAPAVVRETFFVRVPAQLVDGSYVPMTAALPTFLEGSIVQADNGIEFLLVENIDFSTIDDNNRLRADVRIGDRGSANQPLNFIVAADGVCVSGQQVTESFAIGAFQPFRKITLANQNVTDIISITDDLGNRYHVVGSLTHDVVYKNVLSTAHDNDIVRDALRPVPAPYRCTISTDLGTRRTTLTFGGGSASTLEDDVIPDPTDFAIPMPYSQTFSRIPVNPERLLQTKTLGVAASNTTLHVIYRHGGGLGHCVPADTIRTRKMLRMIFPHSPTAAIASEVRGSVEVTNRAAAVGGEDPPTIDELKSLIPSIRNTQERIVTREDLLARVYTLPSNFGRVFRAAIRSNPTNPLATQLFIVSRDATSRLIMSPDTLKQNLVAYLNPYRMIGDAIDILDARIINIGLTFELTVDPALNRNIVLQAVLRNLQTAMNIKNFHIDQPIIIDNIRAAIYLTPGILSINALRLHNIVGTIGTRRYSDETHDVAVHTKKGLLIPPPGGIFECRYAEHDIVGRAI